MDGRLRQWRDRRGWSLRELGERSGVSYVTIQRIEAGTANPSVRVLQRLAEALEISLRDLFPRERPKKRRGGR